MYIPCHQTENQNNFRQGTLENDWTSTSELERNVVSYTPTSPVYLEVRKRRGHIFFG
jgi:hypothetical protein